MQGGCPLQGVCARTGVGARHGEPVGDHPDIGAAGGRCPSRPWGGGGRNVRSGHRLPVANSNANLKHPGRNHAADDETRSRVGQYWMRFVGQYWTPLDMPCDGGRQAYRTWNEQAKLMGESGFKGVGGRDWRSAGLFGGAGAEGSRPDRKAQRAHHNQIQRQPETPRPEPSRSRVGQYWMRFVGQYWTPLDMPCDGGRQAYRTWNEQAKLMGESGFKGVGGRDWRSAGLFGGAGAEGSRPS